MGDVVVYVRDGFCKCGEYGFFSSICDADDMGEYGRDRRELYICRFYVVFNFIYCCCDMDMGR